MQANEFLFSVFGCLIAIRKIQSDSFFLLFPKVQKVFFVLSVLFGVYSPTFIGIFLISLIIIPKILKKIIKKSFENNLVSYLDRIILSQKSGKSFRQSCVLTFQNTVNEFEKKELLILLESLSVKETGQVIKTNLRSPIYEFFCAEMTFISQQQTQQLEQMQLLRRHLKTLLQLRHKSGQISQQAKAQAVVISILFVLMSIFMSKTFGWHKICSYFYLTLPILLVGLFVTWKISRSFKWSL